MRDPVLRRWFAVGAFLLVACPAGAADLSTSAYTSLWSRYMWRGLRCSSGAVIQSNVSVEYAGFSGSLWTNYDLRKGKLNEIDPTIAYAWKWGGADLSAGWSHYFLMHTADNDEVYASATMSDWFLSPSLTCYWDLDLGKGLYWQAGLAHGFVLNPQVTFNLSATAGYVVQNRYVGVNAEGKEFADWFTGDVIAALPIAVSSRVTIEPRLGYSFPLSRQAREVIRGYGYGTNTCTLYGALVVSVTF
jgi:hypothetical protein